jgi:peptidoglycan-associated lipoprotein
MKLSISTLTFSKLILPIAGAIFLSACASQQVIPEAGAGGSGGSDNGSGSSSTGNTGGSKGSGQGSGAGTSGSSGGGGYSSYKYTPADLSNPSSILATRIIYFDYDQASIKPEFIPVLNAHAQLLANYPDLRIRLEGHADERGTREYNVALSERRAQTVQWYLRGKNVRSNQTETIAYGEEKPIVVGSGEKSWAKNRRVEIKYIGH